ncbi:hypothetical protein Cpir12675_003756 [Ceratocystis pirilliformis]|uniref:N-acetyltransferase B complex (NatB) non catalytic subunit n=1 Tax=Ceratocystis pirilliformis TaxID=259994 RepID=A0ABR3Z1V4_9PEZI
MSQYWNIPKLKRGVDLQVQSAYSDGDWQRVARLAAKHANMADRQYHEILKVSVESQMETPVSRYAAVAHAHKMLQEEVVILEIESFELLDWATKDIAGENFFHQVIGPLRLRAVKSGKLSRMAMVKCFEACLRNWDLESAQQIAAYHDRSFKQDRFFTFWNIAVTFLLATSDQHATEKRALYATLASRMALKANQDTIAAPKALALQEEEVLVYYTILSSQGSLKDWQDLLNNDTLGPVAQCRLGRKEPFLTALRAFENFEDWPSVYQLTKAGITDPESTDSTWKPSVLASDWVLWQYCLKSARYVYEANPGVIQEIRSLLEAASVESSAAINRRTIAMAKILACFELGTLSESGSNPDAIACMTEMVQKLTIVIRFEDLRPLVQRMSASDMDALLAAISNPLEDVSKPVAVVLKCALLGKLRLLIATCQQCPPDAFRAIARDACTNLRSLSQPLGETENSEISSLLKNMDISDARNTKLELSPDFSILIAVTLINLSGLTPGNICNSNFSYLLQAIAILENQLHITPKDHTVLILLVRLHILIGSAWRAKETWDVLDVKRTIVDSLAPLFLDRLSTISPVLVYSDRIVKTVLSYYETVFKTEMPKSIVEAIHARSYSSIIQIPKYIRSLKTSSTRAMGYFEKQRAHRAFTGKAEEWRMADVAVYSETIDFGPFPRLESSSVKPIYDTLSIGPKPSNTRTQLSILAEKFFSTLNCKPPSFYKPSPSAIVLDEVYVAEELSRLANMFGRYLSPDAADKLTPSEHTHYQVVALLTLFILSSCPPAAQAGAAKKPAVDAIISALGDLVFTIEERLSSTSDTTEKTLKFFSSLHDLWYIRDTANAIRVALDYITAFNGRQKPPKPPTKDVASNMKALATSSAAAMAKAKSWLASAKGVLTEPGFERKLVALAFAPAEDSDNELTHAVRITAGLEGSPSATWARAIVSGWKTNIIGWEQMKW